MDEISKDSLSAEQQSNMKMPTSEIQSDSNKSEHEINGYDYSNRKICNSSQSNEKAGDDNGVNIVYLSEDDLEMFEHQVSGHGTMEKGLLKHKNGCILKPLQLPPKGTRETLFYERVHGSCHQQQETCYISLKRFVPKYYGVAHLKCNSFENSKESTVANETPSQYLILEDILEGLKKPCVADVKLGSQTWSPDASEAKIKQEMGKYVGTKMSLGICFTGMHYYDISTNKKCKLTRDVSKKFNPSSLKSALETFFNVNNSTLCHRLITCAIEKLRQIEQVFNFQKSFKLYGSSVLIAYDADFMSSEGNHKSDLDITDIPLKVYMIDFAHFHPSEYDDLDENYLFGLRNLIKILCDIADTKSLLSSN